MMKEAKKIQQKKQNDTNLLTTPYINRANISLLLLNYCNNNNKRVLRYHSYHIWKKQVCVEQSRTMDENEFTWNIKEMKK